MIASKATKVEKGRATMIVLGCVPTKAVKFGFNAIVSQRVV
jgi:hypothetical protein